MRRGCEWIKPEGNLRAWICTEIKRKSYLDPCVCKAAGGRMGGEMEEMGLF